MKKVFIIFLFLLGFIPYSSAQFEEYEAIQKNPMDTVVFIIDTSSSIVKIDSCKFNYYFDDNFSKKGFCLMIKGSYYQSNKPEYRVEDGFEKIFLFQLLSNTIWYKVEDPIIYKTKKHIGTYITLTEEQIYKIDNLNLFTKMLGIIPWLNQARCFVVFKKDWDNSKFKPIKMYRVAFSCNQRQW